MSRPTLLPEAQVGSTPVIGLGFVMKEFHFRPVEISMIYPVSGLLTYQGFIAENDELESVMRWENTQIHNFVDERFDYVSVVVESLLQMLGKEPRPDQFQRLILPVAEDMESLAQRLRQNNFPRIFQPIPTEKEVALYSQVGSVALEVFLDDVR